MDYAGVILKNQDNKILLQLRDNKKGVRSPNLWGTFGGGIEKNENPKDAAIRETYEELGIKLKKSDIKFLFEEEINDSKYFIFTADFSYNLSDIILKEGSDMRFFSVDEIKKLDNLVPLIKKFSRYLEKIELSCD